MKKIFLTGITGLVGSAFVVELLKQRDDFEIVCLARKSPVKSALQRTQEIVRSECEFNCCPEIADKVLSRVSVIEGDVVTINPEEMAKLPELQNVDIVFHCAADVNLGPDPTGKTFRINFNGTQNIVKLAQLLKVKEFHYVGTAYVAGKLTGTAIEDKPVDSGFNNPYEESKYKAEMLVRASGIPFSVYRPGIITGRRSDGRIRKPLAFYRILEFLGKVKSNSCAKLKVDPKERVNLPLNFVTKTSEHIYFVPIDYVKEVITALFQKPVRNIAYHVTGDSPVTTAQIRDAISKVLRIDGIGLGLDCPNNSRETALMGKFIGDLFPYFGSDIYFDQSNVRRELGDKVLDWEYGVKGLETLIRSYYLDYYPNVDWIQYIAKNSDAPVQA